MAVEQYALCDANNIVQNVCTWDGNNATWTPPGGITPRGIDAFPNCEIGDTFDGTTLTKAIPPPEPLSETNRKALYAKGAQALASNITYLAIPSPTQAQAGAQVQSLTKQTNALIRLTMSLLDNIDGT
jgi:hypothetical protein